MADKRHGRRKFENCVDALIAAKRDLNAATAERDRYRDAIVDALADLTPGIAPYGVLADALEPRWDEAS